MAQKKFKFHPGVKKCHFGNFSEWAGMAVRALLGLVGPQESLTEIEKLFLSYKYKERLEGKIKECLFFYVKIF